MWAITPRGVGKPVGARSIRAGDQLIAGEAFDVADWTPGAVLAEDEISLRAPTAQEATAANVPPVISMFQARAALVMAGHFATIDAALQAGATDAAGQIALQAWQHSAVVSRASPLVVSMAGLLGLSEADVDALFTAASQIEV